MRRPAARREQLLHGARDSAAAGLGVRPVLVQTHQQGIQLQVQSLSGLRPQQQTNAGSGAPSAAPPRTRRRRRRWGRSCAGTSRRGGVSDTTAGEAGSGNTLSDYPEQATFLLKSDIHSYLINSQMVKFIQKVEVLRTLL